MASGLAIAVVGATGAAGQTTLRVLEERKFPVRELRCFASERSVGSTVTFCGEALAVRRVEASAFSGLDLVFCSAGSAQAKEFVPMIRRAGAIVADPAPPGRAWLPGNRGDGHIADNGGGCRRRRRPPGSRRR